MTSRVEAHLWTALSAFGEFHGRLLGGGNDEGSDTLNSDSGHGVNPSTVLDDDHGGGEHSSFGVHITYEDLYSSIIFFTAIYVMGFIAQRFLKMPSLVGEIFAGIFLGPNLADFVPNPAAFVMLGEIGLILLVLEAGIDIDLTTLKVIGARGIIIAIVGSILPIALAMAIAFAIGTDTTGAIAAGAAFGPTSLGIAMNILRQGKIVNTPVGQLVISAAVIDDMIALVILSQLSALTGSVTISSIIIPIVSAIGFLVGGGYVAVYILPGILDRFIISKVPEEKQGYVSMCIMLSLMLGLMPATYYAKASFLMGVFVSGLTFCRSEQLHHTFVRQFKRLLQWLMRIFFAASIGFQVPITHFGNGTVVWKGCLFTLALLGKIAVGFLVPNFNQTRRFSGMHMRDCLITGFSMAAEGEFAFVIAVYAVDQYLISQDLYASIVLAVLISTIIPPFLLRFTISHYNKKAEEAVQAAADLELNRNLNLESHIEMTAEERDKALAEGIKNNTACFLCIQTQSNSAWGLLPKIMNALSTLKLEVIDHRSWHPRGVDTTAVNEIFVRDNIDNDSEVPMAEKLNSRIDEVRTAINDIIDQPSSKVRVNRWLPGVLEKIVEESVEKIHSSTETRNLRLSERIMNEATTKLERDRELQMKFTRNKSVQELLGINEHAKNKEQETKPVDGIIAAAPPTRQQRRMRQKMRSTPVIGGDLFGDSRAQITAADGKMENEENGDKNSWTRQSRPLGAPASGQQCELISDGEIFKIRISSAALRRIRNGYSGGMVDDGSILMSQTDLPIEHRLQGFVRNQDALTKISEERDMSEVSDSQHGSDRSETG